MEGRTLRDEERDRDTAEILAALEDLFVEFGWEYERGPGATALTVAFHDPGREGERYFMGYVEGGDLCLLTSFAPLAVPRARDPLLELLLLLNELNGRMAVGTFYLDREGGWLQFVTPVSLHDERGNLYPREALVVFLEQAVQHNLGMLEALYPAVRAVAEERQDWWSALEEALESLQLLADMTGPAGEA